MKRIRVPGFSFHSGAVLDLDVLARDTSRRNRDRPSRCLDPEVFRLIRISEI